MKRITTAILIVSLVSVLPVTADLTDGLQVHYNFDDPDAPLGDRGLQGLHGTAIGTQMVVSDTQAVFGKAMYTITGSAMKSIAPMGGLNLNEFERGSFTVSFWFLVPSATYPPDVMVYGLGSNAVNDGVAPNGAFETEVAALIHTRPRVQVARWAEPFSQSATGDLSGSHPQDKWSHIVWMSDITNCCAFFAWFRIQQGDIDDPDLVYSDVDNSRELCNGYDTNSFGNDHLIVGWNATGKSIWIDELSIWNRELSQAELEELHDLGVAGEPLVVIPSVGAAIIIW